MSNIFVGDEVPLSVLIGDGNETLFPQAVITNDTGATLTTIDLTHQSNGLYINTGAIYSMPSNDYINATYIFYEDAGHTTESPTYYRAMDTFALDNTETKLVDDFAAIPADVRTEIDANSTLAADTADAVWDEATGDHTASGSFGEKVGLKLLTLAKWLGLR